MAANLITTDGAIVRLQHQDSDGWLRIAEAQDDADLKDIECTTEGQGRGKRAQWRVHHKGGNRIMLENVKHDGAFLRISKDHEMDAGGSEGPMCVWVVNEVAGKHTFKSKHFEDEDKYYLGFDAEGNKKEPSNSGGGRQGRFEVHGV